jgi:hypothetical protein
LLKQALLGPSGKITDAHRATPSISLLAETALWLDVPVSCTRARVRQSYRDAAFFELLIVRFQSSLSRFLNPISAPAGKGVC